MAARFPTVLGFVLLLASSASAQVGPPCCSNGATSEAQATQEGAEESLPFLIGRVDRTGTRFTLSSDEGEQAVELFTTDQQAAEQPRRVDLRGFRGKTVIVVCQPWYPGDSPAWGCKLIGRIVEAKSIPRRP